MRLVIGQLGEFAHRVAEGLESADWKTRREIICALVKEIRVGMESARIVYRVTPPPLRFRPPGDVAFNRIACELAF